MGCSPSLGSAGAVTGDLACLSRQVTSQNPHMGETMASELGLLLVRADEILLLARINSLQVPFELCEHPSALEHVLGHSPATLPEEL